MSRFLQYLFLNSYKMNKLIQDTVTSLKETKKNVSTSSHLLDLMKFNLK